MIMILSDPDMDPTQSKVLLAISKDWRYRCCCSLQHVPACFHLGMPGKSPPAACASMFPLGDAWQEPATHDGKDNDDDARKKQVCMPGPRPLNHTPLCRGLENEKQEEAGQPFCVLSVASIASTADYLARVR
jgi:hypothetical protein